MDHFEKFENQFLSSYESTLDAEVREICKKINFLIKDDEEFDIDKAQSYWTFFLSLKENSLDKDFINKYKKLKYDISNFKYIKYNLDSVSETRKNQKKSLNE